MKNVALVGGGKIGIAIAELLGGSGDYRLTVFDRDAESLERMPRRNVETRTIEISDARDFARALDGHEVVLSASPFSLTTTVAEAAKRAGAHYLDLTEDVESTRTIRRLADGANTAFIPQCGLAPGFIGLYQVNVQVPQGVAAGDAVPVVLSTGAIPSNTVTISVR